MLLYDIYYRDGSMDRATRLPKRAEPGAIALCANGDGHAYMASKGQWIDAKRDGESFRFVPAG